MQNAPKPSTSKETEVVPTAAPPLKKATYPPEDRSSDILHLLDSKRCEGEFCDVQLKLGPSKTVYAHKALLAACCQYFEGMFMSSFMESESGVVDLSHATENPELFGKLIDTFYGHKLEINEANVGETLNLATMLLLEDLKQTCNRVIQGMISLTNAAEIFVISISFDLKELLERVTPLIKSRFHDFIMFQEELYDFTAEQFSKLLSIVDIKYVSRKTQYLNLLVKWFSHGESDSRAEIFIDAIDQLPFKVTKSMYKELDADISEIVIHLDDVNSDVSKEVDETLRITLDSLKPIDYDDVNRDSTASELEPEPVPEVVDFGTNLPIQGPRLEHEYTKEDDKIYKQAHEDMAERDLHREYAKRWPPSKASVLYDDSDEDPEKPAVIKYEMEPDVFLSRKFREKTEIEKIEESTLLNGVVVLAPSVDYAERMAGRPSGHNSNMLDICVYIPRKLAWYKIGSIAINSIQKFSGANHGSYSQRPSYYGRPEEREFSRSKHGSFSRRGLSRLSRRDDDFDSDEEEDEMLMHMMMDDDLHDSPEVMMMMMKDMPSRQRRLMMEHMMRGHDSPGMRRYKRDMMRDRDMDRSDMSSRMLMMMRESEMHRRMRGHISVPTTSVPPLTNAKWKMVYLEHKLYFYHQDFLECVFGYDLATCSWKESGYRVGSHDSRSGGPESIDSVELVVMGKKLYAVILFVMFQADRNPYRRRDDDDFDRSQEVHTYHKILQMDEKNNSWQMVFKTEVNHTWIEVDRKPMKKEEKERLRYMDHDPEMPMLRVPGCFKTVLHVEDPEKLHIFLLRRKRISEINRNATSTFMFANADTVYIDLNKSERNIHTPYHQEYLGQPTPLYNNFLIGFVNDELKPGVFYDTGVPGIARRFHEFGSWGPERGSPFLDAMNSFPLCPAITATDGRSMWILHGEDNSISELTQLTLRNCSTTRRHRVHKKEHPPPPFRVFTLATVGRLQQSILRRVQPPCRFLQCPDT